MKMTRNAAVSVFVGFAAVVAIGLNAHGKGHLARDAAVAPVDCNRGDPFLSCLEPQWGYPAADLFITGDLR
jgi:hypothetical protein